jgi:hypothetical protein
MSDIINICTKQNVVLQKNKKDKRYNVFFVSENKNYRIADLINLSLYRLIEELNRDVIDRIEIIQVIEEDRELDMLIVLNPLFKELGSFKYFMSLKTTLEHDIHNNMIIIKYLDIPYEDKSNKLQGYTKITHDEAILSVKILSPNIIAVNHNFEINIFEMLPNALQNVVALMVKTALLKIKICLEGLTENE